MPSRRPRPPSSDYDAASDLTMTVCIEGNIGAGKSELLRRLAADGLTTRPEPVDRWRPLLNQVYNCGRGLVALQARITLDSGMAPSEAIVERDPAFQVPVFIKKALDGGSITRHEAAVLTDLHARVVTWRPSQLIYLRCSPAVCLARVRRRARVEEDGLDLAALSELHGLYENAFGAAQTAKEVIDATDLDADEVHAAVKALLPSGGCCRRWETDRVVELSCLRCLPQITLQ